MPLTLEQVVELAPDAAAVAAGKKLMARKNWQAIGRSTEALWGLCQGSRHLPGQGRPDQFRLPLLMPESQIPL